MRNAHSDCNVQFLWATHTRTRPRTRAYVYERERARARVCVCVCVCVCVWQWWVLMPMNVGKIGIYVWVRCGAG